jgi:RND family efflux transporter MFP subunit
MIRKTTFIVTIAALFLFLSCGSEEKEVKKQIRPVKSMTIGDVGDDSGKGFPGVTKEYKDSEISFRVGGPITKYNVIEGEKIKKGALIAEIDPRDYKVTLQSTQARYDQAKAESDRFHRLWKKGSVSKNSYERRYATYLEAEATLQDAKNGMKDTKLYAPFTGFFGPKLVELGQEVRRKQTVATIVDLSIVEVITTIPEQLAVQLLNFDKYEVHLETYPNIVFKASLKELEKKPTAEGFVLHLYLDHKNKPNAKTKVAAGMSCRVNIILKETSSDNNKIIIPLSSVFEGKDVKSSMVWVINPESNSVKKQKVIVGNLVGHDAIEIVEGLSAGEEIVVAGVHRLTEGDTINDIDILK